MKWLKRIGIGFAILIGAFLTYLGSDFTPAIVVQTGEDMPKTQKRALLKAGIIDADEEILYYYSEAVLDIKNAGTIVTDKDVTGYWTEESDRMVMSYAFEDIHSVELDETEEDADFALYWVNPIDENLDSVGLLLSTDEDMHLKLIETIKDRIPLRE